MRKSRKLIYVFGHCVNSNGTFKRHDCVLFEIIQWDVRNSLKSSNQTFYVHSTCLTLSLSLST